MSLFGSKKAVDKKNDAASGQDTPEVRMLREVWDIPADKKEREKVAGPVSSDIYARGAHAKSIPPRVHGRRVED